jgi:hypothetical protein
MQPQDNTFTDLLFMWTNNTFLFNGCSAGHCFRASRCSRMLAVCLLCSCCAALVAVGFSSFTYKIEGTDGWATQTRPFIILEYSLSPHPFNLCQTDTKQTISYLMSSVRNAFSTTLFFPFSGRYRVKFLSVHKRLKQKSATPEFDCAVH